MKISEVLEGIRIKEEIYVNWDAEINGLALDSRKIHKGYTFFAVKGTKIDGHKFIDIAIENGAELIVCETIPERKIASIGYILVENVRQVVALAACNYYEHPSRKLKLIGITGTNGKTTTVMLTHQVLNALNVKCGMLTTIKIDTGLTVEQADLTTPDAIVLNQKLSEMVQAGCQVACMEVSSHALDQFRVYGQEFYLALFTNISRDHIGYHGDFKSYIAAKKLLFDNLSKEAVAIINDDDPNGQVMVQNSVARVVSLAMKRLADYKVRIIENSIHGLLLELNGTQFYSNLVGGFNAYNLTGVYAIISELNLSVDDLFVRLSQVIPADGRFERILDKAGGIIGIVDYCHTPDALEKVLKTIEKIKSPGTSIITVVGCGGDRDSGKRPIMGNIAATLSDRIILTSDNPRTESPYDILDEIINGVAVKDLIKVQVLENRRLAIQTAVQIAKRGDVVLLAGKGHEAYQEIKGVKYPFDDRIELRKALGLNE